MQGMFGASVSELYLLNKLNYLVHVLSLCSIWLLHRVAFCGSTVTVYRCLKVCQYLKLSYYAPKQNHVSHYAHIYLAAIMLKTMPA